MRKSRERRRRRKKETMTKVVGEAHDDRGGSLRGMRMKKKDVS